MSSGEVARLSPPNSACLEEIHNNYEVAHGGGGWGGGGGLCMIVQEVRNRGHA